MLVTVLVPRFLTSACRLSRSPQEILASLPCNESNVISSETISTSISDCQTPLP
jgi:hypothetical protein